MMQPLLSLARKLGINSIVTNRTKIHPVKKIYSMTIFALNAKNITTLHVKVTLGRLVIA